MKRTYKLIISMVICLSVLTCGYFTSFTSAVTQSNAYMSTTLVDSYSQMTVSNSFTVEDMKDEMTYFYYNSITQIYGYSYKEKTATRCRSLTFKINSPNFWTYFYYASYVGRIEGSIVGSWSLNNP